MRERRKRWRLCGSLRRAREAQQGGPDGFVPPAAAPSPGNPQALIFLGAATHFSSKVERKEVG